MMCITGGVLVREQANGTAAPPRAPGVKEGGKHDTHRQLMVKAREYVREGVRVSKHPVIRRLGLDVRARGPLDPQRIAEICPKARLTKSISGPLGSELWWNGTSHARVNFPSLYIMH